MKKILSIACAALVAGSAFAQQALWGGTQIVSPQINPDSTVTFRCVAPKAKSVQVTGDFLPENVVDIPNYGKYALPGVADLVEKNGVWEFTTTNKVASEYYCYNFIIDGQKTVDPANVYINRDVATITNCFIVSYEKGDKGDVYKVNDVPHGTIRKMWYDSPSLGMQRRITVYTPAGYETSGKKYPVFYLLHGSGGDEEAWYTQGRISQQLDNLIAAGKAEPMIVVMTNGNAYEQAAPGESPLGFQQPQMVMGGVKEGMKEAAFELSFPDVRKFVEKNFRTINDKKHRAIAGLSMGSFHSEQISKYYAGEYGYVGLFSGSGVGDSRKGDGAPSTCPVYKDFDKQMANLFSPKNKPYLYFVAIGKIDFLKKGNDDFLAYMDAHKYPYEYLETEGGHIWRNWRIYFTEFSQKIFK
ncbi:MAG: esterase [Bacteroidales bacterium]|nr:esterase [Bacteroidales bacterium]